MKLLLKGLFLLLVVQLGLSAEQLGTNYRLNFKLLYEQNWDKPEAIKDFVFSDPAAWRIGKDAKGDASLELFGKSNYTPKHRSPLNIAIIRSQVFEDFILDVEMMSTVTPYPHQDMCVFFGFEATNKFYYAHLGLKRDALAHNVTIVNDAPRAVIPTQANEGVTWGQNVWHKIRLDRNAAAGTIKVYFDDLEKPVMTANGKTFWQGYIGFGSFDDKGAIRRIKIYGPSSEMRRANFFKPAN